MAGNGHGFGTDTNTNTETLLNVIRFVWKKTKGGGVKT